MSLDDDVRSFHLKYYHVVREKPTIPPDEEIRFRLRLIAEEFMELISATLDDQGTIEWLNSYLKTALQNSSIHVDFPAFVDALGDLDYVIAGTRVTMGVDPIPIAREIHRANMSKEANDSSGKPRKPENWIPPRIAEELIQQGWESPVLSTSK